MFTSLRDVNKVAAETSGKVLQGTRLERLDPNCYQISTRRFEKSSGRPETEISEGVGRIRIMSGYGTQSAGIADYIDRVSFGITRAALAGGGP